MMKKILKHLGQLVALAVVAAGAYLVNYRTAAFTAFFLLLQQSLFLVILSPKAPPEECHNCANGCPYRILCSIKKNAP
ncbi:MAG: hypothetical protein U1F27_01025 [Turneriella sp.]